MANIEGADRETWLQPVLPGMSERQILEGFGAVDLIDYKLFLLERYSDLERQIHLVNDVLGGYGVEEQIN